MWLSHLDQCRARVHGNSCEQKRPSTFSPWFEPCCLAGNAHMMGTQVHGHGHMIGTHDQLKGVLVNILCSHTYPLYLVYVYASTLSQTCTMHRWTSMLFYSSAFSFFPHIYLCFFFIFSYPFPTLSQRIFSSFIDLSPSLCFQPQLWFSVSSAVYCAIGRATEAKSLLVTPAFQHHAWEVRLTCPNTPD